MLVIGTSFVATVLKTRSVQVLEKQPAEDTIEVKPVKVSLQVREGNATNVYSYTLRNIDTVVDLMDKARDDKKIYFEKTQYTNRITIDNVNNSKSNEASGWRIFINNKDITDQMDSWKLIDNETYQLMLVPLEKN